MEECNKYSRLNGKYQQLNIYYDHLEDEKNKLANELYHLQLDIQENEHKKLLITEMDTQIEELYKLVDDKKVELANLSSTAAEILLNEQAKLAHIKELELSIKEAERRNSEVENKYDDLMAAIDMVKNELTNLTHLKNSVLAIEEGNGHQ
jgi:predicted RNase H-like nuclease (RuvC/YqgF family)